MIDSRQETGYDSRKNSITAIINWQKMQFNSPRDKARK